MYVMDKRKEEHKKGLGALICDFDGTLINKNSEAALIRFLISSRQMGLLRYTLAAVSLPINLLSRSFGGCDLLRAWTAGLSSKTIETRIDSFLAGEHGLSVNPEVAERVRAFPGRRILITGSNQHLVEALLVQFGLREQFDEVVGAEVERSGVVLRRHPYGKCKLRYLPAECAIGFGNEFGDRFFLQRCTLACAVNPDPRLDKTARKHGWEII